MADILSHDAAHKEARAGQHSLCWCPGAGGLRVCGVVVCLFKLLGFPEITSRQRPRVYNGMYHIRPWIYDRSYMLCCKWDAGYKYVVIDKGSYLKNDYIQNSHTKWTRAPAFRHDLVNLNSSVTNQMQPQPNFYRIRISTDLIFLLNKIFQVIKFNL